MISENPNSSRWELNTGEEKSGLSDVIPFLKMGVEYWWRKIMNFAIRNVVSSSPLIFQLDLLSCARNAEEDQSWLDGRILKHGPRKTDNLDRDHFCWIGGQPPIDRLMITNDFRVK